MEQLEQAGTPQATIVLRLAYAGGQYSGFAEQPQTGVHTVAGELRSALETFLRREVELTCAGRTDAGVHALSQYVSFSARDEELDIAARRWLRAMDALLPRDIAVQEVFHAPAGFSARFDALARTYVYRIADRPNRPVLTRDRVWWLCYPLDDAAMARAAACLVGEHDFKSFCKASSAEGKPTCRNVMSVGFERGCELGEDVLSFTITGNAFLHSMVRTIECRKALPVMVNERTSSPSSQPRSKPTLMTFRQVGLPSAEDALQKLLKSCSPTRHAAARAMAASSSG